MKISKVLALSLTIIFLSNFGECTEMMDKFIHVSKDEEAPFNQEELDDNILHVVRVESNHYCNGIYYQALQKLIIFIYFIAQFYFKMIYLWLMFITIFDQTRGEYNWQGWSYDWSSGHPETMGTMISVISLEPVINVVLYLYRSAVNRQFLRLRKYLQSYYSHSYDAKHLEQSFFESMLYLSTILINFQPKIIPLFLISGYLWYGFTRCPFSYGWIIAYLITLVLVLGHSFFYFVFNLIIFNHLVPPMLAIFSLWNGGTGILNFLYEHSSTIQEKIMKFMNSIPGRIMNAIFWFTQLIAKFILLYICLTGEINDISLNGEFIIPINYDYQDKFIWEWNWTWNHPSIMYIVVPFLSLQPLFYCLYFFYRWSEELAIPAITISASIAESFMYFAFILGNFNAKVIPMVWMTVMMWSVLHKIRDRHFKGIVLAIVVILTSIILWHHVYFEKLFDFTWYFGTVGVLGLVTLYRTLWNIIQFLKRS